MYINVNAIILRVRRDQENAKRLSLYTEEWGRLNAVAVGVQKPGARLAAATEPWVRARFRLWKKESSPHARVTGGAVDEGHTRLRTDWRRTASAAFVCEWTEQLTAFEQPHPEKFALLCQTLKRLETENPQFVRLAYFVQFLRLAGYGLSLPLLDLAPRPEIETLLDSLQRGDLRHLSPDGDARWAGLLEERLLRFVAPLSSRPFESRNHEFQLHEFRRNLDGAAPRKEMSLAQ